MRLIERGVGYRNRGYMEWWKYCEKECEGGGMVVLFFE